MRSHDTQYPAQTPQKDPEMGMVKAPVITTRSMTSAAMGCYQARTVNIRAQLDEYESESKMDDVQQDSSYHISVTNMADEVEDFFQEMLQFQQGRSPMAGLQENIETFPEVGPEI